MRIFYRSCRVRYAMARASLSIGRRVLSFELPPVGIGLPVAKLPSCHLASCQLPVAGCGEHPKLPVGKQTT